MCYACSLYALDYVTIWVLHLIRSLDWLWALQITRILLDVLGLVDARISMLPIWFTTLHWQMPILCYTSDLLRLGLLIEWLKVIVKVELRGTLVLRKILASDLWLLWVLFCFSGRILLTTSSRASLVNYREGVAINHESIRVLLGSHLLLFLSSKWLPWRMRV